MLVKAADAARALTRPDPAIRLYVFAGPDESGSRALVTALGKAMGKDAERIDLSPAKLREDPAILADEAAAMGLFGGARWISVSVMQGGGDEMMAAAENLLAAPVAGNPVAIIGGSLTGKSKITRLAEKAGNAIAVISYPPEGAEAERIADAIAQPLGLSLDRETARAIVDACGGDRGLMAQEIAKLALYCDADADAPVRADMAMWHAIGADLPEEDIGAAVNIVLDGRVGELPMLFATLAATGASEIRLVRALAIRAHLVARLRVAVEGGDSPRRVIDAQGKAIFWKEVPQVTRQLGKWDAVRLARLIERLHMLERELKAPDNAGMLLLRAALTEIARQAASIR